MKNEKYYQIPGYCFRGLSVGLMGLALLVVVIIPIAYFLPEFELSKQDLVMLTIGLVSLPAWSIAYWYFGSLCLIDKDQGKIEKLGFVIKILSRLKGLLLFTLLCDVAYYIYSLFSYEYLYAETVDPFYQAIIVILPGAFPGTEGVTTLVVVVVIELIRRLLKEHAAMAEELETVV